MPPSRVDRAAAWVLLLAVAAAYVAAWVSGLPAADAAGVPQAADEVSLSAWWASLPAPRPLLTLSYALNQTSGAGVAGFHAVDVTIHAANTLLLYAVLRRLTHNEDIVFRDQRLAAFLAATVFALHPLQAAAVLHVPGRAVSLPVLFALLSLAWWLRGREYDDPRDLYLRAPAAFALALLAGEFTVVLPLAMLLAARQQSGRSRWLGYTLRESTVHWLVAAAATGAIGYALQDPVLALLRAPAPEALAAPLAHAQALVALAVGLVRPDLAQAGAAMVPAAPEVAAVAAAATLVLLVLAGLFALPRRPMLAFALLWFALWAIAATVAMTAQPEAAGAALYLALAGPALGAARLLLRLTPRLVQWALVPVVLVGLGVATYAGI